MRSILAVLALCLALTFPAQAQQIIISPSITPNNVSPGYFNLDQSLLPHWRGCVSKVRGSTGRCTMLYLSDSTGVGAGAGSGGAGNLIGARPKNWPTTLDNLLNGYVAVNDNAIFNDQAVTAQGVTYAQYDPRVSLSGAGMDTLTTSLGGVMFHYTTGAAATFSFKPVDPFDTIIVYWLRFGSNGSFTVNVDGGASLGTITTAGASSIQSTTFSPGANLVLGTHTINLVANNDGSFNFLGVISQNSTKQAIDIIQADAYGLKVSGDVLTASPWSSLNVIGTLAPTLCYISLTINDSNSGIAGLAQYGIDMQTLITKCKLTGDVVLSVGPPSNTTQATDGTLDQFIGTLQNLATTNGAPMVNIKQRWVSFAAYNPICTYFDTLHPSASCYQDIAEAYMNVLAPTDSLGASTGAGVVVRAQSPTLVGHLAFGGGNIPVLSTCGGGSPTMTAGSTDASGTVTVGTATATCTMTFGKAYTAAPFCAVSSRSTLAAFAYAVSNTAITITATTLGGDVVDYFCSGT